MGKRLEDASCAICIDSLFNKRDDLDDIIPIATCECGHVFHEPCLLEWFKTQSQAYLIAAREAGVPGRHGSPTLSDAPVECPSCRAECFADPETGNPIIHRLYITFDGRSSSVQPASSPLRRDIDRQAKRREEEALGLAKRAKQLTEDVVGLGAESREEEMEGTIKRTEGLVKDLELSAKAASGIKTYVGGLIVAVNKLRSTLEDHPVIHALQGRIFQLESTLKETNAEMKAIIPNEIRKAKEAEQAKADKKIKRIMDELEVIQRELEKEKVARRAGKKEMDERAKENEKKILILESQLRREAKEKEDLQATLRERTKMLKMYQSKADSRKELKAKVQRLETENARLQADLKSSTNARRRSHKISDRSLSPQVFDYQQLNKSASPQRDIMYGEILGDDDDPSIQEMPPLNLDPTLPYARSRTSRAQLIPATSADESSLLIDMPSFHDDSLRHVVGLPISPKRPRSGKELERQHPTARTISFDLDEGLKRRKANKSKYFPMSHSSGLGNGGVVKEQEMEKEKAKEKEGGKESRPQKRDRKGGDLFASDAEESEGNDEPVPVPQPRQNKINPFATSKRSISSRARLPTTSAIAIPDSPLQRATFCADSEPDHQLVPEVNHDGQSSPGCMMVEPKRVPLRMKEKEQFKDVSKIGDKGKGKDMLSTGALGKQKGSEQKSVVDWLGIRDPNGRPKAGTNLMLGRQIKKRL
ncbi:hypothetical protein C345_04126 [Cryptococcus neoformans A2-102-5]|nr:hypothetical protein C346_04254 [Cryptococcus neoformans var. grubii D17-1]OXG95000.1 hypothetical protein C345_04126 [Cryptococcus neoformans var. grubii A2-102-5]